VFLASDDDGAAAEIAALAENLGFSPIKLGRLSEGGLFVQARGNDWGQLGPKPNKLLAISMIR
jgi:predicted dinucleotide-binding enzyme